MTFNLLTNSEGKKMGKTAKGALWLDPENFSIRLLSILRNVADSDVEKCLALLTFLPMDEVRRLGSYKDQKINEAKQVLAYEVTNSFMAKKKLKKLKKRLKHFSVVAAIWTMLQLSLSQKQTLAKNYLIS